MNSYYNIIGSVIREKKKKKLCNDSIEKIVAIIINEESCPLVVCVQRHSKIKILEATKKSCHYLSAQYIYEVIEVMGYTV